MSLDNKSQNEVISLLKKRHLLYSDVSEERAQKDPYWYYNKPMNKRDYAEWIEFGVNSIMSIGNMDRRKAEIEMTWIESKYPVKVV
jgi:hypothetical protein